MKSVTLAYLLMYNIIQFLGWFVIAVLMAIRLSQTGQHKGLFDVVEALVLAVQAMTILETVHSVTGLSKSSPVASLMQYMGRGFALFFITLRIPGIRNTPGVALYLAAWAIGDCTRYPFYISSLLGSPPYWLTWLRYSMFVPLYPLGFFGELMAIYAAGQTVLESGQFSVAVAGQTINFYYVLCCYAALGCFGFFQNYSYMFSQRKKALKKFQNKAH